MSELPQIPSQIRNKIESLIETDEQIRWLGQPNPFHMVWLTLPVTLFSIPWGGFALYWMIESQKGLGQHRPITVIDKIMFPWFGLPFVLVAVGLFLAPLWLWLRNKRTIYFITNKRAVLIEGSLKRKVRSFTKDKLNEMSLTEQLNGLGNLIFAKEWVRGRGTNGLTERSIGFFAIPNVREVEKLVREI